MGAPWCPMQDDAGRVLAFGLEPYWSASSGSGLTLPVTWILTAQWVIPALQASALETVALQLRERTLMHPVT